MDIRLYWLFAAYLLLMSLVAFILYGRDKGFAKRGARRTPEKVLLGVGFFGGALGALLGMKKFRHKTKHWYFYAVNVLGLLIQIALEIYLVYLGI